MNSRRKVVVRTAPGKMRCAQSANEQIFISISLVDYLNPQNQRHSTYFPAAPVIHIIGLYGTQILIERLIQ